MSVGTVYKDPDALLDYGFDWSLWLQPGDTISSSTWQVEDGLTASTPSHTATTTTVWLSGGTAGRSYQVTNRITTAGGRTDERTMVVRVVQR